MPESLPVRSTASSTSPRSCDIGVDDTNAVTTTSAWSSCGVSVRLTIARGAPASLACSGM